MPNQAFYQPHHELWHRQQNQQELHRRHNAPTPIDLSSARRPSYRSTCTCHCTTAHNHHHRPLPSTGGAVRNLDSNYVRFPSSLDRPQNLSTMRPSITHHIAQSYGWLDNCMFTCQAAECVCSRYTINFIPRPAYPMTSHLSLLNSPPLYQSTPTSVESPQNLIMMTPNISSSSEVPQKVETGSTLPSTILKKNMTAQSSSSSFEPVAGPSGLQRQSTNIVSNQNVIDSDSSDLEDDAEVAAMNLQKRVIHPYRNITRANLRHFIDSDDSSECNQPPQKRTASQPTTDTSSNVIDDDVIFVSSTKEPTDSIDLTLDDDSNEVVSVTTSTQTQNPNLQRRENVLRINHRISPMWGTSNSEHVSSHPHIMARDSCLGFSMRANNLNNEQQQQQPTIIMNSNTQNSSQNSRDRSSSEVLVNCDSDPNTPVYNIGAAPSEGGTTNLRFRYNLSPQRPSHVPTWTHSGTDILLCD
uniref:Uncharacterized protein n=1 Tax=Megaselia scalaris TaxID=36166 RepID=T1GT62_MEGSC